MKYKRSYPVFVAEDGNRFVFPGLFDCVEEGRRATWEQCLSIAMALNVTREPVELSLEFDENAKAIELPHLLVTIQHSAFAHGGEEVMLIGGPLFDQAVALNQGPTE